MTREPSDASSAAAAAALSRLSAMPYLGRNALIPAVDAAIEGARSGRGTGLLLIGEAGIGKTRTADEIVARAQASGLRPVGAGSHDMEGAPALWPWIQLTRRLCAGLDAAQRALVLADDVAVLSPLISDVGGGRRRGESASDPLDPGDDRYRLFAGFSALLQRVAKEVPLVVVLDDLHWADPASVLLMRYAVRELRRDPIVFVGLYRDTDVLPKSPLARALDGLASGTEVFRLEGLDRSEATNLIEYVAGFEVSKVLSAAICAQTGGNPLFLLEVLRLLASEGRLGGPDAPMPDTIPLPMTVRQTLRKRFEAVEADDLAVLEQAAVFGSEFDRELLEAALSDAFDVVAALDHATSARLIERVGGVPGRFHFVHDLIKETLDAGLSLGDRAELHRRAGLAIVKSRAATLEEHLGSLANHFLESASIGTAPEAIEYSLRAAERAAELFSFEYAVELYGRTLRALDLMDANETVSTQSTITRANALVAMGHALWQSGQRREAREAHLAAAALARRLDDPTLLAQAAIGLSGRNDVPMDFPAESGRLMEEALEALPREDSRLRVRLLAHLVRANYFGEDHERLLAWSREAVAIADRLGDPGARFAALESLHYAQLVPAHLEERLAISKQLPELARRTGSLRFEALAWLWRAFDLLQVPDVSSADAAIARFEDAAQALRQPFYEWLAVGLRATRALMSGRLDESERLLFRAFELGQRADSANALLFFGTQLFHLRVAQGRANELMPVMQKIVEDSPALPVFRIGIPLIHALEDRRDEARRSFEEVAAQDFEDVPHDLHRLPMLMSASVVCAYLEDTRRAEILLRELSSDLGRVVIAGVATFWAGPIDRSLGQLEETLGHFDAADQHFAATIRVAHDAGARLIEAHALVDRARVLARRASGDDHEQARQCEGAALGIYRDLGIDPPKTPSEGSTPPIVERRATGSGTTKAANRFQLEGRTWYLDYAGSHCEIPNSKGLTYLRQLIAEPDREIHVVDLIAPEIEGERSAKAARGGGARAKESGSSSGRPARAEILDATARNAYRERLREIESLRSEAEGDHDLARVSRLDEEAAQIEAELSAAFGLGGRARAMGDPVERARKAVYNRIRAAIRRIAKEHPALGRHLEGSVRTGTTCCYRPDRPEPWRFD